MTSFLKSAFSMEDFQPVKTKKSRRPGRSPAAEAADERLQYSASGQQRLVSEIGRLL